MTTAARSDTDVTPFRIDVPDADLADLRDRLARTRFPEPATAAGWEQGVPLGFLRELVDAWRDHDWRATEARLAALPQFRTTLDGLGVHFAHVRSPEPDAFPIVLTHGWPGSFLEFEAVLGPLTDPVAHGGRAADAFHVVVPSLPGYGFGDRPTEPGWGPARTARAWRTLMARLGYPHYGAQGGDWGMLVTAQMAEPGDDGPPRPAGIHLSPPPVPPDPATLDDLTPAEQASLESMRVHRATGTGYSAQMSTRPQTVGYALTDSPAGLAAWIVEKLWYWSDHGGRLDDAFPRRAVLDLLSLYWLTATPASAARMYWESARPAAPADGDPPAEPAPSTVPVGAMIMPADHGRPSRRWAARRYADIRRWTELDRGGHFPAVEVPRAYIEDLRGFFAEVR